MLEQPQAGLIGRFYRQVENRPKNMTALKNRMKFKIFAVRICTYKEHKMTPFTPQLRKRPVRFFRKIV